jgi:hypothetical protein
LWVNIGYGMVSIKLCQNVPKQTWSV